MRIKDESKLEALIQATVDLVYQVGLSGLTMKGVAEAAGLATGTLYIYADSKEDLILKTFLYLKKKSLGSLPENLDHEEPFAVQVKKIWMRYFEYCQQHRKELVFMEQFMHSPYMNQVSEAMLDSFEYPIIELLKFGQKQLLIKDMDCKLLISAIYGITRQAATTLEKTPHLQSPDFPDKVFRIVWDAVRN